MAKDHSLKLMTMMLKAGFQLCAVRHGKGVWRGPDGKSAYVVPVRGIGKEEYKNQKRRMGL